MADRSHSVLDLVDNQRRNWVADFVVILAVVRQVEEAAMDVVAGAEPDREGEPDRVRLGLVAP